jgi:hypothetical protein
MLEEIDPLEFIVARDLGMTLAELDARMGAGEWVRWRAFYVYEGAMKKLYGLG